tara:strand:- start:275 stop:850 length:576 start_codon:yes stop_codon:yes gene_type:complete
MNVLYFDIETDGIGGFNPPSQRVVQVAWDHADKQSSYLVRGVEVISPQVPHSFKVKDCREQGMPFEEIFAEFMTALRTCDIAAAHNIEFDKGVILNELRIRSMQSDEFLQLMKTKAYCSMKNTINICRLPKVGKAAIYGGYKYPKLSDLYVHLTNQQPKLTLHDARNDVQILKECINILADRGLAGLSESE